MNNYTATYTFYSYKGGSCRSSTLLNTVKYLAEELDADDKHPILLIDADVESAGITFFLEQERKFVSCFDVPWCVTAQKLLSPCCDDTIPEFFSTDDDKISFGSYVKTRLCNEDDTGSIKLFENAVALCRANDASDDHRNFNVSEKLNELLLTEKQWDFLFDIAKKTVDSDETSEVCKKAIATTYNIWKSCFCRIVLEAVTTQQAVVDFLPATIATDVTASFGISENGRTHCIRFVGAEVGSPHAPDSKEKASAIIQDNIVSFCNSNGYRAVVFDSGAGTQTVPHTLHKSSDVIVYCMRPTKQFILGTKNNIKNYAGNVSEHFETLRATLGIDEAAAKGVNQIIILPTATPNIHRNVRLLKSNLLAIQSMGKIDDSIGVDVRFCEDTSALGEIESFKLEESILSEKHKAVFDNYHEIFSSDATPEELSEKCEIPADEIAASRVYRSLAIALRENTLAFRRNLLDE